MHRALFDWILPIFVFLCSSTLVVGCAGMKYYGEPFTPEKGVVKNHDEFEGTTKFQSGEHQLKLQDNPCRRTGIETSARVSNGVDSYFLTINNDCIDWLYTSMSTVDGLPVFFRADGERIEKYGSVDGSVVSASRVSEWIIITMEKQEYQTVATAESSRLQIATSEEFRGSLPAELKNDMQDILKGVSNTID